MEDGPTCACASFSDISSIRILPSHYVTSGLHFSVDFLLRFVYNLLFLDLFKTLKLFDTDEVKLSKYNQ